ncbi:MAG: CapA family protein [Chloroflexota bacterium]
MSDGAGPSGSRPDISRILVIVFGALFLIGALAFGARVLTAIEQDGASPEPSASTSAALPSVLAVAAADPVVGLAQGVEGPSPSPSPPTLATPAIPVTTPCPDPSASQVPGGGASAAPTGSPSATDAVAATSSPAPTVVQSPAAADPCGEADPSASPSTAATAMRDMPFVPVVRFWQTRESISSQALTQVLRGKDDTWKRVLIPTGDREALEAALGITIPDAVREASPSAIIAVVKRGSTLGLLRASDVVPSVRALAIDGRELFGNDRVAGIGRWPLVASVMVADGDVWRQSATWTLVAGGDSFTDRGLYERVVNRKKGVDYPFDGGTARVTGHHICPSCPRAEGNSVPIYKLSGPKGVVRDLVQDADLAIANHEQPTPTNWSFHLFGTRFSGKPDLTRIFTRAGIDFMSLANNHINDYGASGVMNTLKTLDEYGIKHAGAGKNTKAAAKPAYLEANGVTVGIVSCDLIALSHVGATKSRAGAAPCKSREVFAAIKAARAKADVLIVFPHWGVEFSRGRLKSQERLAARWERMGVDLVLGAHAHVPGGIGDIDGMPVFYSLGNFIFDQSWSTATMEGILAEMTFQGDRLVQIRIHPFLTHDQAQPNLLDPAKDDGAALMNEIRKQSKQISDW